MTKSTLCLLKNRMLLANLAANSIGALVYLLLVLTEASPIPSYVHEILIPLDVIVIPACFGFGVLITFFYELPIRRYLNLRFKGKDVPAEVLKNVRQRLLNEPIIIIVLDLLMWILVSFFYSVYLGVIRPETPLNILLFVFFGSATAGLSTITAAFFAFEFIMQRLHIPFFFPEGGLHTFKNTLRIKIKPKLVALLFAANLIPFISILGILTRIKRAELDPVIALERLETAIMAHCIVFIILGIWLTFLVSSNLVKPLKEIIKVLKDVQDGDYAQKVRITSNDEIGYAGEIINEMNEGLKERDKFRRSLNLAKEVQQNLLPASDPEIPGLEISGTSIYCDETGGDYFDYIDIKNSNGVKKGIVIGDVSGHGISSALLMATARASLRQRAFFGGSIGDIITDVNRRLCVDVETSGRFMTLFFLSIDPKLKELFWVRAGHPPGIYFHPDSGKVEELKGRGIVLGLDAAAQYQVNLKKGLKKGEIIMLGTDGIWEATDHKGKMFGKERILSCIKQFQAEPAKTIGDRILSALYAFRGGKKADDDITLLIIKIK